VIRSTTDKYLRRKRSHLLVPDGHRKVLIQFIENPMIQNEDGGGCVRIWLTVLRKMHEVAKCLTRTFDIGLKLLENIYEIVCE
jgi:hypothetical protein